jgi:hypothetical protein
LVICHGCALVISRWSSVQYANPLQALTIRPLSNLSRFAEE